MKQHDYEVAKHLAERCLKFHVSYNEHGKMYIEICGQRWDFPDKTDAEVMEEITSIWTDISVCMWEIVNQKVLSFIQRNKTNFN
jgi:hypothetical protein